MSETLEANLILAPHSICCVDHVTSKKLALDVLSGVLAATVKDCSAAEILEGLVSRERLGSTALGDGVAMPHTRLAGIAHFVGGFVRLATPVDFGAPDKQPVQLLFGLLIPEDATDRQLREVRVLVRKLRDRQLQQTLTATEDPQLLFEILSGTLNSVEHT